MNNKKNFFSTAFCIFIAVLFILGCNNHLLKLQQEEAHLIVKIANSTGARNASTTGDWQISAWIENQDGSESHHQNLNSASGEETSLTFDGLVIGSQINIHLELIKNDDTQTKLTGTSGWKTIEEGVNVIIIVLREDHGAQVPVIKEINSTIETYTSNPKPVTATLKADASVADGGTLTYQWYSSDSPTTDSGTAIEGATNATYDAHVEAGQIKYFYCVVTNTNSTVNGNKTASATSNIATVASIVGELTSITARYIGNYELVNSEINYSNIEIVQVYAIPDAEPQEISVVASSVKDQYTIELQDNNGIGNVPATVTHVTETQIKADFTIPVKYQLNASNLSITGNPSVEQNGTLSLTANYAAASGAITYKKYDTGSSTTYNVKDNVTVTWTGGATGNSWTAIANTQTTGQQTATVKLTPKDEWCVTTGGVEKSHSYEVTEPAPSYDPTVGLSWDSSTSYLTIYNEAGLKNFRDIVNGDFTSGNISVDGKTFSVQDRSVKAILATDIVLTENWTPIADNSSEPYQGTFDGNGYIISGITVSGSGNPKGFFGSIGSQALIKNLTVEGTVDVTYYAGGIAGYVDGGTIEYCINKINVTSTSTGGTGGIVGYISSTGATITGCVNFGNITSDGYTGGIAGGNTYSNSKGATIDRCINLGTITSNGTTSPNAGGIYGYAALATDTITNSVNFGTIVSTGSGAGITNNDDGNNSVKYSLNVGIMDDEIATNKLYAIASNSSGTYSANYFDSEKITRGSYTGGTGKTTSELKVDSAWDTSWTTTNWSFAAGRYPVPNIQKNIPATIWDEIVAKAQQ